ncbi:MAG: HAD family hydrolase [Planctomycetota bacterium]|jgi:HAD superfamily hydrolase (TIGR01509 family)
MNINIGLIFDVDGVIADTEAVNARATIKVFEDYFDLKGVQRADFQAGLGRGAEAYVQAAAKVHGLQLNPDQLTLATEKRQEYFLKTLQEEPLPPFPGVSELIEQAMKHQDFRVGIATSSTQEKSEAVLKAAGIPYHKLTYVNGNHVKNKKPHPELFLTCAQRMNIPPQRCVVIEDAPNGVESAKAAGSKCIAVTNSTSAENLKAADLIVDSLTQINIDTVVKLIEQA